MDYQHDEHWVHLIVYHLVWTPKRRKSVLVNAVATECRALIERKCSERHWEILELAIQPDHIHLFVRVQPNISASEVVQECKGLSSRDLRLHHKHLLRLPSFVDSFVFRVNGGQRFSSHDRSLRRGTDGTVVLKAYRYRLHPSKPQQRLLDATRKTARRWYDDCLAQRKAAFELVGWSVPYTYQLRQVKTRKAESPFAAGVHSHVLQLVRTDLERAFHAFFRRVKAGEQPGYPRFKGRNRFSSFGSRSMATAFVWTDGG